MKKKFLNDFMLVAILFSSTLGFIFFLIMSVYSYSKNNSPNPTLSITLCAIVFGSFAVFGIICCVIAFELILFCQDKVVSLKISRRIEIPYSEIKYIQEIDKSGMGVTGIVETWEIADGEGKAIYVIRTKGRKKIIEELKEKIKKQELS